MSQNSLSNYEKVDILSGLAQNTVLCLYQDHTGFLWTGTTDGLSRYDGKNFTNYVCDVNDSNTLSNNTINVISEDPNGNLYIGTDDGLNIFDRKKQKFKRIYSDTAQELSLPNNEVFGLLIDNNENLWVGTRKGMALYDIKSQSFKAPKSAFININGLDTTFVLSFYKDRKNNIWIGTYKRGFFKYQPNNRKLRNYVLHDEKEYAYLNNTIYNIYEDSYSNIWVTTNNGIAKLDSEHQKIKRFIYSKSPSTLQNSIFFQSIIQTSDGRLLAGSGYHGMYEYNYKNETISLISIGNSESGSMSSDTYLSMLEDRSGVLWLGTLTDGMLKVNLKRKPFHWLSKIKGNKNSLINNDIWAIIEDSEKNIWIGTQQGLSIWSRKDNKFRHLQNEQNNPNSLCNNHVYYLHEDSKKNIWIGTNQGLDLYNPKTKKYKHFTTDFSSENQLPENEIFSICEDKNGEIWIGTSYGLSKYNVETDKFTNYFYSQKDSNSISSNSIWKLFYDSKNRLWVCTSNGLAKYIPEKNHFERFLMSKNVNQSNSKEEILAIDEDENGFLWLGTTFSGIIRFNPATKKIQRFPILKKFETNTVYAISNYENHIWFSSIKGLGRLDKKTGDIEIFTNKDGIKSNEFNTVSALTADSLLFFGGTNGVTYFKPEQIQIDKYPPPIVFTKLKINFKEIKPGELYNDRVPLKQNINTVRKIELNYDDNVFSITFSSLDYKINEKIEYAYKIVEINENWIELGNENTINFTGLEPGKYTLIVRATNSDGVWSDITRNLSIVIMPPWWRTIGFYILLATLFIVLVIYIIKRREKRLEKDKEILERNVKERTKRIEMQKEEIESQKEVIEQQNKELRYQTLHLEDEIEKRLADLIVARDKAEESDRLKTAILSNMSHELRTPLNAIIGFSELLGEPSIPKEKQNQFLEIIKNNSNDLLNLFDKLIEVSVIQSKKLTLEKEIFKISKLLYELFIDFERKIRFKSKQIEIYLIDADNDKDFKITTDPSKLKQVLSYLISNAIKYTENGKIEFGYILKDDFLEFFVKDTGIGIPKEKIPALFTQFNKLEPSKGKVYRGTGLGLNIAKDLVKLMGGRIWVKSKINEGTTFYFTIPAQQD